MKDTRKHTNFVDIKSLLIKFYLYFLKTNSLAGSIKTSTRLPFTSVLHKSLKQQPKNSVKIVT